LIKAYGYHEYEYIKRLERRIGSNEALIKRLHEICGKIMDYEIPIYVIETCDEDDTVFEMMAEAFIRINKAGVRIGNIELMLSFLAGRIRGPLSLEIKRLYKDLEEFKIDIQPVIRFVFSEFGLQQSNIVKPKQFKSNIDKIMSLSEEEWKRRINRAKESMLLTVEFLKKCLGITDGRILPGQIPLVTIAKFFSKAGIKRLDDLDPETIKYMENWLVLVSFNGYYTSKTDPKLDDDLRVIEESKGFPFDELLKNIERRRIKVKISEGDLRNGINTDILRGKGGRAYLFLLYVALVKNNADNWNNQRINACKYDELAKHHIFPRELLKEGA